MRRLSLSVVLFLPISCWRTKSTVLRPRCRVLCWKRCRNVRSPSVKKHINYRNLFLVLATQNPIEQEGTYPLPEAQVDRFMLKVIIDYPKLEEEKKIIRQQIKGEKTVVRPILSTDEIIEARNVVREVYLDEKIEQYIADIVFATRYPEQYGLKDLKNYIEFGGSPRASINLALAARAYAFIKRRGYVIPEDVRAIAHDVLRHRIGLSYEAEANNVSSEEIISQILNKVEVP